MSSSFQFLTRPDEDEPQEIALCGALILKRVEDDLTGEVTDDWVNCKGKSGDSGLCSVHLRMLKIQAQDGGSVPTKNRIKVPFASIGSCEFRPLTLTQAEELDNDKSLAELKDLGFYIELGNPYELLLAVTVALHLKA
jgi:hypothetical protein